MKESLKIYKSGYAGIVGKPNVGKSTLLNKLVSAKIAATARTPQTTRNKITGVCHFPGGQIILLDTPGIHKATSKLNRAMIKTSMSIFQDVDLILFVMDAQKKITEEDESVLSALRKTKRPKILILNKVDLISKPDLLPLLEELKQREDFVDMVPVSALYNDGLDILSGIILEHLPEGPKYFSEDMVTDSPEQFLISEIIREKGIHLTRLEIPYAMAVEVDRMEMGQKGVFLVYATVYVEKESQKKIIIGEKGAMLKKIGSRSRIEIEKRLGSKVYLNLHVKVKNRWRDSDFYLKEFGYQ